jgi:signal peptidase II
VNTPDPAIGRRGLAWLWLSAVVIVLDQITKLAVDRFLGLHEAIPVTGYFSLVRWSNTGAAFSLLASQPGWQRIFFIVLAIIAAVVIVGLMARGRGGALFFAALALILGGALGNAIDRMAYGHVIDFLLFHYREWYWPAFNVADSAITVGAGMLIWDSLRRRPGESHARS